MGSAPKGNNPAVQELLISRQEAVKELKVQLARAQTRMKKYADQKRSERHFSVGDWVYLKLQPYRQISSKGKTGNQKLSPKFYGPFEIIAKMGKIAYHLNLPPESLIHPVFHVSQLKKRVGSNTTVLTRLPLVGPEGKVRIILMAILNRRILKRNNQVAVEVLVQWANLPAEEASWEDYQSLIEQFPEICLEDKTNLENRALSATQLMRADQSRLVVVREIIESVNSGNEGNAGPKEELMGLHMRCSETAQGFISVLMVTGENESQEMEKAEP
jgi:Chromo (CHRromatin Organisation MOdifier) domain